MKNLFKLADQYLAESDWKDLALVKCCLCAMGVMIGVNIPAKHRTAAASIAAGAFAASYLPLMTKLFRIARQEEA